MGEIISIINMYFWKINKLKEDLVKQPLLESESFKYLIATTIVYSLAIIPFGRNNIWDIYMVLIMGIITIMGVYYAYQCNKGSNGTNFLQKYLSISWVVGIRWSLLLALPVTFIYFVAIEIYVGIPESTILSDVIFFNLLSITFFWLLGKHIKDMVKSN